MSEKSLTQSFDVAMTSFLNEKVKVQTDFIFLLENDAMATWKRCVKLFSLKVNLSPVDKR